ncbi:hypothetical protein BN946_scf185007.g7 [Trametes cinnabarina]|uniref:DUF7721 domain-containing protein n=1 Tax=Pycnoporus cinnabarinus TaxID=5643 RepID=A0A060SKK6_PYCCI|nr:hypothetical protein BN946_scf185007.g7 [Trametes cinnabarina]
MVPRFDLGRGGEGPMLQIGAHDASPWSAHSATCLIATIDSTTMDNFMNFAKQGMQAYERSHSDVSRTGGQEYNAPSQTSAHDRPQFDDDEVVNTARREGSGDSSLFSSALSFVKQNKTAHQEPIDEEGVQHAHRKAYEEGSAGSLSAGSLGSAAALQVLRKFTSGGASSGGGSQSQLISLAMAEASKLFDQSGGASSGNKQDAVNGAAMTIMKLLVQSKFSGGPVDGANSGGLSALMGLASKFI